jgi:hypothetical protein
MAIRHGTTLGPPAGSARHFTAITVHNELTLLGSMLRPVVHLG